MISMRIAYTTNRQHRYKREYTHIKDIGEKYLLPERITKLLFQQVAVRITC